MKGKYEPFSDGYGIVGFKYVCPNGHEAEAFSTGDEEEDCAVCGFTEPGVDPDEWYEAHYGSDTEGVS